MSKARSANRDKAFKIWKKSGGTVKLKDIAATLGVGDTQIRKWKNQDKWEEQLNSNVTISNEDSNCNVTKKKRGAPKGSKNALGNIGGYGGPPGNKKAVKTGEFETIWYDTLDDNERNLLHQLGTDPVQQLDEEIKLLTIRERRMLKRIQDLNNGLSEKAKKILQERILSKKAIPVNVDKSGLTKTITTSMPELVITEIQETEFRKIDDINRIEEALTRVQDKKLKALETKHRLTKVNGREEEKLDLDKKKYELDKKIVALREKESDFKAW